MRKITKKNEKLEGIKVKLSPFLLLKNLFLYI